MEDSFRVRVDKAFGSLGNTASSVNVSPSLWRLTDDEIKRQEWNRNKVEQEDEDEDEEEGNLESGPSVYPLNHYESFSKQRPLLPEADVGPRLESDLQDLSDYEEEEGDEEIDGERKQRRKNHVTNTNIEEEWDVQSLIGLDYTLDYEEEEDEYDKVAVCREVAGDRLYMRDVKVAEYGFELSNRYGELPNTFQEIVRDPRANHVAAKLRLKEDAEAAENFNSLQSAANSVALDVETEDLDKVELDGDNPKPILKKKGSCMDSKTGKRVRFSLDPKWSTDNHEEQESSGGSDIVSEPCSRDVVAAPEEVSDFPQHSSGVPDYLRNPSKYTCYALDSSVDMDEQSNRKAYMDFFSQFRNKNTDNTLLDDTCVDIQKSIIFTPKKKPGDLMVKRMNVCLGDALKKTGLPIGVVAEDAQASQVCAMEEDEAHIEIDRGISLEKSGRRYRPRTDMT